MLIKVLCIFYYVYSFNRQSHSGTISFLHKYNHLQTPDVETFTMVVAIINWFVYFSKKLYQMF